MVNDFVGGDVELEAHVFRGGHWCVEIEIGKVNSMEGCTRGVLIVELKRSLAVRRSVVGVLLLPGKSMQSPPTVILVWYTSSFCGRMLQQMRP